MIAGDGHLGKDGVRAQQGGETGQRLRILRGHAAELQRGLQCAVGIIELGLGPEHQLTQGRITVVARRQDGDQAVEGVCSPGPLGAGHIALRQHLQALDGALWAGIAHVEGGLQGA